MWCAFNLSPAAALIHSSLLGSHYRYGWFIKYFYETALAFCPALLQSGLCISLAVVLPSPPLTPHFTSSVCLPSHILSNEAKSSMLNGTSQLCHWCWNGHSCLLLPLKAQTPLQDNELVALETFTVQHPQIM